MKRMSPHFSISFKGFRISLLEILINEMILIWNELNLEQHKKICISQKKGKNEKKIAEKQIEKG